MLIRLSCSLVLTAALAACSQAPRSTDSSTDESSSGTPADGALRFPEGPVVGLSNQSFASAEEALDAAAKAVAARAEVDAAQLEVSHILIGVKSPNPRMQGFKHDATQAREKAAAIVAQLQQGADFWGLVLEHTEDRQPGREPSRSYKMGSGGTPRASMVAGFGNVSWRLKVGEIGVLAPDPQASPFGYHIIQRVK